MRTKRILKILASTICCVSMILGNITVTEAKEKKVADKYHNKFDELYSSMVTAVQNHDVDALRNIYEPGTSEEKLSEIANQDINIEGTTQFPSTYIGSYDKNSAVYMTGYYAVENPYQANYDYSYSYNTYTMKRVKGEFYLANPTNSNSEKVKKVFCKNVITKKDYRNKNRKYNKIWIGNHQPSYSFSKKYSNEKQNEVCPFEGALNIAPIVLWQYNKKHGFVKICFENGFNEFITFKNIEIEFVDENGESIISDNIYYAGNDTNNLSVISVQPNSEVQKIYPIYIKKSIKSWDNLKFKVSFDYNYE